MDESEFHRAADAVLVRIEAAVAESGTLVNIPSARDESRFNPDIDKMTGYRTSSLLAVPLRDGAGDVLWVPGANR